MLHIYIYIYIYDISNLRVKCERKIAKTPRKQSICFNNEHWKPVSAKSYRRTEAWLSTVTSKAGRSQKPRGLRRRSAAAHLLRSWVRIPPGAWMLVCCECCVLSGKRSLRRADHSSRGVLPTVVRRYVWSRKPQEWGHDPRWVAAPQKKNPPKKLKLPDCPLMKWYSTAGTSKRGQFSRAHWSTSGKSLKQNHT